MTTASVMIASAISEFRRHDQAQEAELLADLNERMQRALLAAGVRVQSVCVESNEGKQAIRASVTLADARRKQDAALVLDRFRLRYHLM